MDEQSQIHRTLPLTRVLKNEFTHLRRDQLFVLRNFAEENPGRLVVFFFSFPIAHRYNFYPGSFHWRVNSVFVKCPCLRANKKSTYTRLRAKAACKQNRAS